MFSIVIPAYNSASTIERTLNSVLCQTKINLVDEIIVVDDGSTDDTSERVEKYQIRCEKNPNILIKVLKQKNAGPSAARNRGMKEATSKYIAFLDADDVWVKDKLECQAEILKKNPKIDLLCGGKEVGALCILFRKHNELYHLSLKDYCWKSVIFTSTVIINRQRIQEIGYFDENMKYCEDMNYYQRFFKWNQVYYLPKKLILYGSNREYYGQAGLSSHLKEMHMGRAYNFKILRKDKQISNLFYIVMICFGNVKYLRRILLIKKASKNKK